MVVTGGEACSEGHGFKSRYYILDGHFLHKFVVNLCEKTENKRYKRQGLAHLKITIILLHHLVMTKLVVYRFCVLNKWSNPGHFLAYFHSFQTIFSRKKLQASAGYELGLSAWKTSTLTTRPPMRPLCMCCSIRFFIFRSELIIETFQI